MPPPPAPSPPLHAVTTLVMSPDRARAMAQTQDGELHLWQLDPLSLTALPGSLAGRLIGWIEDGVVLVEGGHLAVRGLDTRRPVRRWKVHTQPIERAALSPDGGTVLTLVGKSIALSDVLGGEVRHRKTRSMFHDQRPLAAHPDGSRFFRAAGEWLHFDGFGPDDPSWSTASATSAAASAAYSPDGRWLAVGGACGNLQTFTGSSRSWEVSDAHPAPVSAVVWATPTRLWTASGRELRRWRIDTGESAPEPDGRGTAAAEIFALAAAGEDRALAGGAHGAVEWVPIV